MELQGNVHCSVRVTQNPPLADITNTVLLKNFKNRFIVAYGYENDLTPLSISHNYFSIGVLYS